MFMGTTEINRITLSRVRDAGEPSEHEAGHHGEGLDVRVGQRVWKKTTKVHVKITNQKKRFTITS